MKERMEMNCKKRREGLSGSAIRKRGREAAVHSSELQAQRQEASEEDGVTTARGDLTD